MQIPDIVVEEFEQLFEKMLHELSGKRKRKGPEKPVLMRRLLFLADQSLDTFTATFKISFAAAAFLHFVDLLTHDNSLKINFQLKFFP